MPIYGYKCNNCEHVFEVLKYTSEDIPGETNCPQCGTANVVKQLSGSLSFSIKGPGVYDPGFSSSKSNKRRRVK